MAERSNGPDTDFGYVCTSALASELWFLSRSWLSWVLENNCVKYYPDPSLHGGVIASTPSFGYIYTVTFTPSMSWNTHRPLTTIVWNTSMIQMRHGSEGLLPRHIFWLCLLYLGDTIFCQVPGIAVVHGSQHFCEKNGHIGIGSKKYGPDKMWTEEQTASQTELFLFIIPLLIFPYIKVNC